MVDGMSNGPSGHDVIVIGDGPGGLSAALFLAKNKLDVVVFGQDKTAMNYALIKNYLGIPEIMGTEFQSIARKQVTGQGAVLRSEAVETIAGSGGTFTVTLAGGERLTARYLVLSEGKGPRLAKQLGLAFDEANGIATDRNALTSVAGVYVVGRSARPGRSQAIISAGDGAAAAIDILARDQAKKDGTADKGFLDWDEPPAS
jgi:thioredoxin reductase